MTTSTLSVLTLAVSDDASQGRNNAGAQMATGMSGAVFFAAAGAVMALAGGPDRQAFRLITAAAVAIAVLGLLGARRALCAVPPRLTRPSGPRSQVASPPMRPGGMGDACGNEAAGAGLSQVYSSLPGWI